MAGGLGPDNGRAGQRPALRRPGEARIWLSERSVQNITRAQKALLVDSFPPRSVNLFYSSGGLRSSARPVAPFPPSVRLIISHSVVFIIPRCVVVRFASAVCFAPMDVPCPV